MHALQSQFSGVCGLKGLMVALKGITLDINVTN